jgi:hypothetical protein
MLLGVGVASAAVGWRVLSHRFVYFFATLGPRFGTLLTLLVQLVLGSQKFDEGLLGSIALLKAGAYDAQIAAGTVPVTWRHSVKQTRDGFPRLQIGQGETTGMQVAPLAQGDQLFYVRTGSLGLGDGRLHPVLEKNGRYQVPQQSAAVAGVSPEFVSCIAMAHRFLFLEVFRLRLERNIDPVEILVFVVLFVVVAVVTRRQRRSRKNAGRSWHRVAVLVDLHAQR